MPAAPPTHQQEVTPVTFARPGERRTSVRAETWHACEVGQAAGPTATHMAVALERLSTLVSAHPAPAPFPGQSAPLAHTRQEVKSVLGCHGGRKEGHISLCRHLCTTSDRAARLQRAPLATAHSSSAMGQPGRTPSPAEVPGRERRDSGIRLVDALPAEVGDGGVQAASLTAGQGWGGRAALREGWDGIFPSPQSAWGKSLADFLYQLLVGQAVEAADGQV